VYFVRADPQFDGGCEFNFSVTPSPARPSNLPLPLSPLRANRPADASDHDFGAAGQAAARRARAQRRGYLAVAGRWSGTEGNVPPGWPNIYSTTCCNLSAPDPAHTCEGQGCPPDDPSGLAFYNPSSTDFTLQAGDVWFFEPNAPLRPLTEMISTYHATCGANTVMELDFAIDRTGNVDPAHAALYKAFGDWRRACYGSAIATTTLEPGASSVVLSLGGGAAGALMDRVVLQEAVAVGDYGQCVANYTLEVQLPSGEWLPFGVSGAHLIGNKRIELNAATPGANGPQMNATAVRFNVTAEWCTSNVNVSAFSPVNCIPPPPPQTRVRYQYKDGRCLVTNLTLPCPGGISCPLFLGDCSLPAAVWNDGDGQSLSSPAAESQPNVVNADCNDCSAGTLFKLITGTGSPASLKFDAAAGRIAYGCGDRSLCLNGGQGAHSPPCNPNEPFRQDQILAAPCSDPDSNGWSRVPSESALPARQPPARAAPAPPPPAIVAAFAADGFVVESALSYGAGVGVSARSATALINNSMSHGFKPAFWVRGSAYEMGFLVGALAEERVSEMTGTFLEHIVPALVSESLDEWLQNSTLAPVYDALCDALADLLVNDSARYFAASVAAGAIPPELVDEMKGVADGAVSANSTSTVTYEKLAA
jgi:hypothetical protein